MINLNDVVSKYLLKYFNYIYLKAEKKNQVFVVFIYNPSSLLLFSCLWRGSDLLSIFLENSIDIGKWERRKVDA